MRGLVGGMIGLAASTMTAADRPPPLPDWMAGCWERTDARGWTEECWTAPRGGIMLGSGRNGVGDRLRGWEAMRIVAADPDASTGSATPRLTFWGAPKGAGRTPFAWQPGEGPGVTFYNTGHDYPQRIRYWRAGAFLNAEIALADGSRAVRWRYRRTRWRRSAREGG